MITFRFMRTPSHMARVKDDATALAHRHAQISRKINVRLLVRDLVRYLVRYLVRSLVRSLVRYLVRYVVRDLVHVYEQLVLRLLVWRQ